MVVISGTLTILFSAVILLTGFVGGWILSKGLK